MGIILVVLAIATLAYTSVPSNSARSPDELISAASAHGGEPEAGFDPMYGWGTYHEPLIQSTLFKWDSNMSLVNDLATGYSVSEDSLVWTVTIRDDVKFTDGVALTAEDVAFSFNTAAVSAGYLDLTALERAEALNDTAVQFILKNPRATFINTLGRLGIVPEHAYNESYGQNPIGSGPYKFVQWDKGQQTIFERNEDYYGQKPYFKKFTILYLENDAAFAAAKKGDVDFAKITATSAREEVEGMKVVPVASYDSTYISLPLTPDTGNKTKDGYPIGNNITSDLAVRKALHVGIDRQSLIDDVLNGFGDKELTGVDHLPWVNPEAIVEDADPEEAVRILEEGGWTDTDGDGIVEKNGLKASLMLYYPSNNPDRQALALALADQVVKFGIELIPEGKSSNELITVKYANPSISGYGTNDLDPVYTSYLSSLAGGEYSNTGYYNNPKVDAYLMASQNSSTLEEAYNYVKLAAWDGSTGFSARGDAAKLYIIDPNYIFLVDATLDIGTPKTQPHGGDPYGNIYDWKRIN